MTLLETTNDTVERIAEQCGLGSAQSLRVNFTRINKSTRYRYRQAFDPIR